MNHAFLRPRCLSLLLAALPQLALATPSGLNNIPTADTTPQGTVVLQAFSTVGGEGRDDLNVGFKTGFEFAPVRLEFGADSHVCPGRGGPLVGQAKLAYPVGDHLPTIAAGVANVPFADRQRERSGEAFYYGVVTEDLDYFRITAGCALQDGEALPFFGIDKTFRISRPRVVETRSGKTSVRQETSTGGGNDGPGSGDPNSALVTRDLFTLRADAIKQQSGDWLYSAGVLVPICKYLVFETWGNFPSDGTDPSLTLKANVVIAF